MIHLLVMAVLGLYTAAALLCLAEVSRTEPKRQTLALRLLGAGFVLQTVLLLQLMLGPSGEILPESRSDYYFWISWSLPLVYGVMGKKAHYPIIGAFLVPLALLFLVSSSYLVHFQHQPGADVGIFFQVFHLIPAVVAEVSLLFAFIVSCVFLIQERRIKRKQQLSSALSGPNLDQLESMNRNFVTAGFVAMTVAILSGSGWAVWNGRGLLRNDIFQWFGIIVWLLLAMVHHLRLNHERSPRALSRLTVAITAMLFVALFLVLFMGARFEHGELYA